MKDLKPKGVWLLRHLLDWWGSIVYPRSNRGLVVMLRRDIRLRKEFLYRKAQEDKDRRIHENKLRIKTALDENKPIPSDLKTEASAITDALSFDYNLSGRLIYLFLQSLC
jgi:hypothetical protein